jgi:SsrA-binding protein
MSKKKPKQSSNTIAQNRRARHDYFLEEKFEAGIALQGWELKSIRAGKVQLTDSYVFFKDGEAWLIGVQITPMSTVSTHFVVDPTRTRKLLLNRKELNHLVGSAEQKGYAVLCTALYWKNHLVKAEISLGKGKAQHDKRDTEKKRDWDRQKQRIMRHSV